MKDNIDRILSFGSFLKGKCSTKGRATGERKVAKRYRRRGLGSNLSSVLGPVPGH